MRPVTTMMIAFIACLCNLVQAAEMRGLWVDAFHAGFRTPGETSAMIARAKECNFNALFVQVRKRGDVYYRSAIEPMAKDVAENYDPLLDVISKAHGVGLEVHAWFSVYEVYHDSKWTTADASQVHLQHPEWLMRHNQGGYEFPGGRLHLDPGHPEVQSYLVTLLEEVAQKYDVDGIHLDLVAYPSREGGYNETSLAKFNEDAGRSGVPAVDDEAWCQWRRAQVSRLVEKAYHACISARPKLKVSAAVYSNRRDAIANRFQDWEGWLRSGILDFVVPMVFPTDRKVFELTAKSLVSSGSGRHVYVGVGGYKMPADNCLAQMLSTREVGFPGVVVYSYHYCSRNRKGDSLSLMDALKVGPFAEADTPPTMAWK